MYMSMYTCSADNLKVFIEKLGNNKRYEENDDNFSTSYFGIFNVDTKISAFVPELYRKVRFFTILINFDNFC